MLRYKSRLMLVTCSSLVNRKLQLTVNNHIDYVVNDYQGPLIKCGRYCIINFNSKEQISNMFLLDNESKPFQVHGKLDILDEGCVIYDTTKEISKEIAYATQICIHAFKELFKNEIIENKEQLLELEDMIFGFSMSANLGWKNLKKQTVETISKLKLPISLIEKINASILIAPMPKISINKKPFINLEEYENSIFVRI